MSATTLASTPVGGGVQAARAARPLCDSPGPLSSAPSPTTSPSAPTPQSVRRRRSLRDELGLTLQGGHGTNAAADTPPRGPGLPRAAPPKSTTPTVLRGAVSFTRGRPLLPAPAAAPAGARSESEGPGRRIVSSVPVGIARRWAGPQRPLQAEPPGALAALSGGAIGKSFDSATLHRMIRSQDKFLIGTLRGAHEPPEGPTPEGGRATSGGGPSGGGPSGGAHALQHQAFTIVFDLDETLAANRGPGRAQLRPGAVELVRALASLSSEQRPVELVLWTASVEALARPVLQRLDPTQRHFTHFIFRDRRWFRETGYTKDLRLLGRYMDRVVIIENSPMSVSLNPRNAVLVGDFFGHAPQDVDLHTVRSVLEEWIEADDFVPIAPFLASHKFMSGGRVAVHGPKPALVTGQPRLLSPTTMRAGRAPLWGLRR